MGCAGPSTQRSHPSCRKAQRFHLHLGHVQPPRLSPSKAPPSTGWEQGSPIPGQREGQILPQEGDPAGDGAELWGSQPDERGKRCCGTAQGAPRGPSPPCSECGRSQPSPTPWYLLSSSTCTPMEWNSLWLRLSVSESEMASTCRGAEGEHWRVAPRCSTAAQHHPHRSGRLRAHGEERSPPGRRWRDATCAAEPSSSAPPGRGWP